MTVRLADVLRDPSGLRHPGPVTTAHHHVARFYREAFRPDRRLSTVELIASAPSPFAIEMALRDFEAFVAPQASPKTRAQVRETARVRVAVLRGVLP